MKYLVCFFIFVSGFSLTKSRLQSIHLVDRNGLHETITSKDRLKSFGKKNIEGYREVVKIYKVGKELRGVLNSYYNNGVLHESIESVNGRARGIYREYYSNALPKIEVEVIEGIGTLVDKPSWMLDKVGKVWKEDGSLDAEITYVKGVMEGPTTYYHKNGKVASISYYKNDRLNGEVLIFSDLGELLYGEVYSDGLLLSGDYGETKVIDGNGKRRIPTENGFIVEEISGGFVSGEVSEYKGGSLYNQYRIVESVKDGEEIYYENGIPKSKFLWVDGEIRNVVTYVGGAIESTYDLVNGKKSGNYTCWYKNGEVMIVELYNNGKLISGNYFNPLGEEVSSVKDGNGIATIYDCRGSILRKVEYLDGFIITF